MPRRYEPNVSGSRCLDTGQILLCVFMDRNEVIMTEQAWSIKLLLYGQRENVFWRDPRRRCTHFARSASETKHKIRFIFPTRGFKNIIKFNTLISYGCPNSEASNLIKFSTLILHVCECPNSETSNLIKFSTLILGECPNSEASNLIKFSTLILSGCPNSEASCKR